MSFHTRFPLLSPPPIYQCSATPAPFGELIPTFRVDEEYGSIMTNDWFFCPGVKKGGPEKAV